MEAPLASFVVQVLAGLAVAALGGLFGDLYGKSIRERLAKRLPRSSESSVSSNRRQPKTEKHDIGEQSMEIVGNNNTVTQNRVNNQISIFNTKIENRETGGGSSASSTASDEFIVACGAALAILTVGVILLGFLPWVTGIFWLSGAGTAAIASYFLMANRKLTQGDQEGRHRGRSTFLVTVLAAISSIAAATLAPHAKSPSNGADRSLAEVSQAIGQYEGPDGTGLRATIDGLLDYVGNACGFIASHHPFFLLFEAASFVFAGTLVFFAWTRLRDGLGYTSTLRALAKDKRKPTKRDTEKAARYLEGEIGKKQLIESVLVAAVIFSVASGQAFDVVMPVWRSLAEWAAN